MSGGARAGGDWSVSWWTGSFGALALAALIFFVAQERSSIERGNRLHRDRAFPQAAAIYRRHAEAGSPAPEARYNLGTTLLALGSSTAEEELGMAIDSPEEEVRVRALHNLGFSRLVRAVSAESGDSLWIHALASVEANRGALRIRPDRPDTKWNLAMAQRMLDSLDAANRRSGTEPTDGQFDADEMARAENMDEGEVDPEQGSAPREGEEEARAEGEEEEPLSLAEAIEILGATGLDATEILSKLLALESRSRWGRQLGRAGPRR